MAKRHIVPKGYLEQLDSILAVSQNVIAPTQAYTIEGQSVTAAAIAAEYQGYLAPFAKVKALEVQLENAYRERDASIAVGSRRSVAVKAAFIAHLGIGHPELDRPGLRRVGGARKLTPEQEVARHAKAKETMKLQGRLTEAEKKEKTYRGPVDVKVVLKKNQ